MEVHFKDQHSFVPSRTAACPGRGDPGAIPEKLHFLTVFLFNAVL